MSKEALPRRGADTQGRIPTQYGPSNPVSDRLKRHQFRVRPGTPELSDAPPAATYAVRPGTPQESAEQVFEALAEKKTREDRRHRGLWLGVAVLALIGLVGACVALLGAHPAKQRATAAPTSPAVAAPAPSAAPTTAAPTTAAATTAAPSTAAAPDPDPEQLISRAATDTAPLSAVTLFPGKSVTVNGHSYTRALTDQSACGTAATPPLAAVLAKNGCRSMVRASYVHGTTAVTVGVAVFDSAAQAATVKRLAVSGNLNPLSGGPLPAFCHAVACRLSVNSFGRYAYFTVAGYTTGKPVPAADTAAMAAGTDLGTTAFQNLATRARDAVAAAAATH